MMTIIFVEFLLWNLMQCYNEQLCTITARNITNYNLQLLYNKKIMIKILTFVWQNEIKIMMKLGFPAMSESPCYFTNCIYLECDEVHDLWVLSPSKFLIYIGLDFLSSKNISFLIEQARDKFLSKVVLTLNT